MVRNRQTAEHYKWGEDCDGWRLLDHPELTVIQERMPPGETEVKHAHLRARQLFYVLDGRLQVELDERTVALERGDALEVAPGQSHRVHNTSKRTAWLLVVSSPSTHRDREEHEPLPSARRAARSRATPRRQRRG
jgi:mannose-6-phosphate isomerase-like protein (cupin superfamily)